MPALHFEYDESLWTAEHIEKLLHRDEPLNAYRSAAGAIDTISNIPRGMFVQKGRCRAAYPHESPKTHL